MSMSHCRPYSDEMVPKVRPLLISSVRYPAAVAGVPPGQRPHPDELGDALDPEEDDEEEPVLGNVRE
jgi:hypothetical protein